MFSNRLLNAFYKVFDQYVCIAANVLNGRSTYVINVKQMAAIAVKKELVRRVYAIPRTSRRGPRSGPSLPHVHTNIVELTVGRIFQTGG